jgi:hypothetical protein
LFLPIDDGLGAYQVVGGGIHARTNRAYEKARANAATDGLLDKGGGSRSKMEGKNRLLVGEILKAEHNSTHVHTKTALTEVIRFLNGLILSIDGSDSYAATSRSLKTWTYLMEIRLKDLFSQFQVEDSETEIT